MPRKAPEIVIEETPGDEYSSLEAAQQAAIDDVSQHLAQTIRDLLASGQLVNVNGKIILNPTGKQ
jgi:hypothetical protein